MTTRFPIECTHCCVKLKVKQPVLGKTVKCPKCKKNFRAVAETDAVLTPEYETDQLLSYGDKKPKPAPLKSDGPIGENVDLVNMNYDFDIPAATAPGQAGPPEKKNG